MTKAQKISWMRILSEGLIIVVSILLAFAIDAWWDNRQERQHELALIVDLQADFEASQAHLETWLKGSRRILTATQVLLGALESTPADEPVDVPYETIVAAIGTPTYSPTDASLNAAIASGRIELLEDSGLRKALAEWRQLIDDTVEDELLIRELVTTGLVPLLGEQTDLAHAFAFDTLIGWHQGGLALDEQPAVTLLASMPLKAAVAQRVFYQHFVVGGEQAIFENQARVLELLTENRARLE